MFGVTVWGRSEILEELPFLSPGEISTLVYWNAEQEEEVEVNVEDVIEGQLRYAAHSFAAIEVSVEIEQRLREVRVPLGLGWNLISINVVPPEELWIRDEGPDIVRMMNQLIVEDHLILMKDELGRFCSMEFEFNNIPYWNLTEGYMVKVDEGVECCWTGMPIPADSEIPIGAGWNYIAYFPTYELDASSPDFYVISPIIDQVVRAKNGRGQFISPEFNFSNMDPWCEGQGYHVNVSEDVVLQYPEEQEEVNQGFDINSGNHWALPTVTGNNMSVLITSISGCEFAKGDRIAAYDIEGVLVGVGEVQGGRCGFAVWGDDPSTETTDGLKRGETFMLRLWDAGHEVEVDLSLAAIQRGDGLVYETDGFTALDMVVATAIPDEFYLSTTYPNPFNAVTMLSYNIPEASYVSLSVFDVTGQRIATLFEGQQTAGYHTAVWDGGSTPSGVYIFRLEAGGKVFLSRSVLLR